MKKAFTLIEVLTASVISVIVLTGISMFLPAFFKVDKALQTEKRIFDTVSIASDCIIEEIKKGSSLLFYRDDDNAESGISVRNKKGQIIVSFDFKNGKILKNGKNLTPFCDGEFVFDKNDSFKQTGFLSGGNSKTAQIDLIYTFNNDTSFRYSYIAKCRNNISF